MPSIFIWKSDKQNVSKDMVRCYIGSNWILEDTETKSKSYQLYTQLGFNYFEKELLVNNAKLMPTDWIGSELLEVVQVPYQLIKSDNYATYEIIGEWNRVTLENTLELTKNLCEKEFIIINKWIENKDYNKNTYIKQSKFIKQDIYLKEEKYQKHQRQDNQNNYDKKQYNSNNNRLNNNYISKYVPLENMHCLPQLANIESFEEMILKMNNLTKSDLINILPQSTYNSNNKQIQYSVKINNFNNYTMSSIPLCSA